MVSPEERERQITDIAAIPLPINTAPRVSLTPCRDILSGGSLQSKRNEKGTGRGKGREEWGCPSAAFVGDLIEWAETSCRDVLT